MKPLEAIGATGGAIGGGIMGAKLGFGASLMLGVIPIVGPILAGIALLGGPIAGGIMGAQMGKQNPTAGMLSLGVSVIPTGITGGGEQAAGGGDYTSS